MTTRRTGAIIDSVHSNRCNQPNVFALKLTSIIISLIEESPSMIKMDPRQPAKEQPAKKQIIPPSALNAPTIATEHSGPSLLKSGASSGAKEVSAKHLDSGKADILCPAVRRMGYSVEVREPIGEGSFSRVYRARSATKVIGRDIAVKIVRIDDPNIPPAWKEYSMRRELRILKRIRHPNVITIHDIVKTRSRIYIFMDLAPASVAGHLEATEEPASEQTARNWFGGISNAVSYLHRSEIAHRDLKNDNILIDSNGNAKLTDFGFACLTYDRQAKTELLSQTTCGSKAYIAPEVFNPPYNPKISDVWSLGVCLFESVTLIQPFRDDLPTHIFIRRQIEKGLVIPKKLQSSLNELLQDLLKKMIEPDINKRIKSDAILIHPWMRMPRD